MVAYLHSVLLCVSVKIFQGFAEPGQCYPPQLDNGVVEAEEGDAGNFFKGEFRCNPGFTLSGPSMLKCRNGVWSGSKPVCSVSGCDPKNLPVFVNGRRLKVKGTRDSVFKYKCNRGFRLFGPKNVYCTKTGWKMDEIPVCARFGCNEDELLGNGVPHGRQRSMFQGAVYRFYCESGSMMEGNSAVYCDGYSWNGTKPECLVPPTPPEISIELDGVEASEPLASVGQQLKLVCKAQGGNPFPDLAFMLNGERVEADNKEMIEHGGYNAVHTFIVEEHHINLDMSCIAENRMTSIPVASNHQTLGVKFGPSNTYIHGADLLKPGDEADYSCTSDESNPASEITVQITDQDGNDIAIEMTKPPKMKGNTGFASALQFKFQVLTHFKSIFMKCEAANGVGLASTGLAVHVMYPPSNIEISGPDHLLNVDYESHQNNLFTCSTDESNPVANIEWVVDADGEITTVPEHSTAVETINQGLGWKKISTLSLPTIQADSVKVHCLANVEDLDFSKTSDELAVDILGLPEEVSIVGPEFILLNSVSEFECAMPAGDTESLVTIHVTDLKREPVNFLMESDNKISVTIHEPQDDIIVECFAENLAGIGPVQTKRVEIHYPPQVEMEGPEQLLPFTMLTYSCSTSNKQSEADISWTVADQDGQYVPFTELSSQVSETGDLTSVIELYADDRYDQLVVGCLATSQAGDGYSEIVAHAVESPKLVEMTPPEHTEAGSELTYECVSPVSSPQQSIRWEVTDWQGEVLQFHTEDPEVLDGYVTSLLHITPQPSARVLTVKCVAYNYVGYVEDVSQGHLTYDPEAVHLTGPSSVLASSDQAVFRCSSEVAYPAQSLKWKLDGQDVTRDAEQTDNVENDGGITSMSVLRLKPTMGGHDHVVECFVGDISKKAQFEVEELSVQLIGVEDGSELAEESPIEVTCSVRALPGLTSFKWYVDQQMVHEGSFTPDDQGMMVSTFRWRPEEGNTRLECRPEVEGTIFAESAGVSFEVVEGDYGYGEDLYLDDNYEEEYSEEYRQEEEDYNVEEEATTENSIHEDDSQYDSKESTEAVAQENHEEEKEYNDVEEEYIYEDESYNEENEEYKEQELYTEEEKDYNVEDDENTLYEESSDAVSHGNSKYVENKEVQDATDNKEATAVSEELFDATQQQQSFAAAEPGSAVLSHESDSSKHVSADFFSPKPLYSSSERTWPVSVLISIIISSISRLVS